MLLDISNHKSLTSAVCTVVVSPHHFSPGALRSHDGKAVDEEGSTTRRNLLYNQQILIQGGIATDMLREAFSQLKGLRHVEIGFAARSVKSILPASDADVDWKMVRNYKWSNGIARMKKTIGMSPITDEDDNMDSLWLVVWSSIGLSKTPLESFGYTRRSNLHALDIQSIKICSTFLMFNATCITSLRKLSLLIDSSNIWGSRHLWRESFAAFLSRFQSLSDLHFDFAKSPDKQEHLSNVTRDLPVFHRLERFILRRARLCPQEFVSYLHKLGSLAELTLSHVACAEETWDDDPWDDPMTEAHPHRVWGRGIKQKSQPQTWKTLLKDLSQLPQLRKVEVDGMMDYERGTHVLWFPNAPYQSNDRIVFQGANMANEMVMAAHTIVWKIGRTESGSCSDDESLDEYCLDAMGVRDSDSRNGFVGWHD